MTTEIKRKFYLGVFVFIGFVLFTLGIFLVGSKQSMFSKTFKINAIFSDVNGLRKGDFVRFSGVKSGIVNKISFLNDSMINVEMKIEMEMQPLIKKDAVASIGTEGLVGNKVLNIRPKWFSRVSVMDNDVINSITPFNSEEIFEKLIKTNNNAAILVDNLAKISQKMKDSKGIFGTLVSDTSAATDLKEIITDIKTTGRQLSATSGDFQKMIEKIDLDKGLAGTLLTDTLLSDELKQTIANLKKSSEYSTKITGDLTKSIQGTNKNTVGMLLNDSIVSQSLRESINNLKQGTEKLNENMEALQHNFLLRKYFKQKGKQP